MDLSTDQRFTTEYGSHVFKLKESFEETDIKGNNNLFNSLKTDTNSNHGHDSSSLFQVKSASANLEVDNSLFSYSSFKRAMDLRTHNRTSADAKRTIFEDAEFFAKNYRYKLLPITFQQVDETIIQSEHNYSLSSLNSESELEEDCSRTMDYSQIKEKNYKRRRTKFREGRDQEMEEKTFDDEGKSEVRVSCEQNRGFITEPQEQDASRSPPTESFTVVQPLDLSAPPLVQENKTEPHSLGHLDSIESENDEVAQLDSDKENMNGIRVTITRPDEKEFYQPCDLFLNDIARLVPWLVEKDCFEVDILDRTCDRHDEPRKNRIYYVISEATWSLFQRTKERVILTNDRSLGQPIERTETDEKPSFLVFDQFSLAKCLADYCQEIGGYFEYTSFEEKKREAEDNEGVENTEEREEKKDIEEVTEEIEGAKNVDETVKETFEIINEKTKDSDSENGKAIEEKETKPNSAQPVVEEEQNEMPELKAELTKISKSKEASKKQKKMPKESFKPTKKSPKQPKPKEPQTSKKSTSKKETSQKSGKPVSRKGRRKYASLQEEEPPRKRPKLPEPEMFKRNTRSKKESEESKTDKPTRKKKETIEKREKVTGGGVRGKEGAKNLRSQKRNVPSTKTKTRSRKR